MRVQLWARRDPRDNGRRLLRVSVDGLVVRFERAHQSGRSGKQSPWRLEKERVFDTAVARERALRNRRKAGWQVVSQRGGDYFRGLRQLRTHAGLSGNRLAALAGVRRNTIYLIERGERRCSPTLRDRLREILAEHA